MSCGRTIEECVNCIRPECVLNTPYLKTETYNRHRTIYKLFVLGYSNEQIANRCRCSERTVTRVIAEGDIYGADL